MKYKLSEIVWLESELADVGGRMESIAHRASCHGELKAIIDEAANKRGKMIRPMLLMLSAGPPSAWLRREELLDAAAAVELTHTASLIHDDVVDDAPVRRNRPTAQSRYGKCAAVYAGDHIISGAMLRLMEKGYSATGAVIAESVGRMCDGELIQLSNRFNTEVSEGKYIEAVVGKTASLFETACFLGSRLGVGDVRRTELMGGFGRCLGIMFQLRDDLSDWTSTQELSGKPVNEDFACGIYTLPAIYSFRDPKYGPMLRSLAQQDGSGAEIAGKARSIVAAAGGVEYSLRVIAKYRDMALRCLSTLPQDECVYALEMVAGSLAEEL